MAVNRRGIVIELVGDPSSYIRAAESTIATNTKLDSSFKRVSVNAKASADAQIAAAIKASEALRANAAELSAAAARQPAGAGRDAALAAAAAAQSKYNRSIGISTSETGRFAAASRTAEKDVGKATRGLLSGATAGLGFGRSLAFASGGFLAFSGVSRLLRGSITGAEDLEKAQRGLDVAIQHTGGSLAKLEPRYVATAKRAQEFGINEADATTGLQRATVLTGNAAAAQRAYEEALVISKATGKDFNSVLTATSKGQEGVTTSLQRYGILIAKGTDGTKQYVTVMSRFAGQARANTTESDRFNAILQNTEETIGTGILPTFNRYIGELGDWLNRMQRSGKLQKDVNDVLHVTSSVVHDAGEAISVADKITGSFAHTLEVLAAFKFASLANGWIVSLGRLAAEWGVVRNAALEADAAQGIGPGNRGPRPGPSGGGNLFPFLLGGGAGAAGARAAGAEAGSRIILPSGVDAATAAAAARGAAARGAGAGLGSRIAGGAAGLLGAFSIGDAGNEVGGSQVVHEGRANYLVATFHGKVVSKILLGFDQGPFPASLRKFGGSFTSPFTTLPTTARRPDPRGPFGTAKPDFGVFSSFQLTAPEEIAQARASLTKANSDDVAAAKEVVARVKKLIDEGRLSGKSLLEGLQAEASALGTIWSAEAATAQQRAQRAAAARARIQKQIENEIDPLNLEVQLSRDHALGRPTLSTLRALKASAEKALASGKLSLAQQKEAYDQITSLNEQIKAAATSATVTFVAPAKLQLALAKDQALGTDQTGDLLKLRRAILKFISTHKKNIAAEIDAYNQLANVNQELGSSAKSQLNGFKQASTKALLSGVGLNRTQEALLRARLSQLGPGGTVPGKGVGAGGFIIGQDNRPIVYHNHIEIGGREIARNTTRHQQKDRRRNSTQRRGPNAGLAYGT